MINGGLLLKDPNCTLVYMSSPMKDF